MKKQLLQKHADTNSIAASKKTNPIQTNASLSPMDPDTLKAMSAPIHSNQMIAESSANNSALKGHLTKQF